MNTKLHSYVHPTLRGLVNLLAPTPTDDPSAPSPAGSSGCGASDANAPASTLPASRCAESCRAEGSSLGVDLKAIYTRLMGRLCAMEPMEPNGGYTDAAQIGPLDAFEVAAVMVASDGDVLQETGANDVLHDLIVTRLTDSRLITLERATLVGASVLGVLTVRCRAYLLDAVQEELARDEERRLADEADEQANASVSVAARRAQS